MTADQFIYELFIHHWFITTMIAPQLTMLYAFFTDQYLWSVCSLFLILLTWR